jgi:phytoene dehydrogenase-like protein
MCFAASDRPLWPEDGLAAILMLTGTRRIRTLVPLSSIAPELAPPGQHLLFGLASPVSSEVHTNIDEELRQVTLDLQEQLPGFEKHGRVLKLEVHDIDDPFTDAVTRPGFGMVPETPVKNLYNVGDTILSPGLVGTAGAVESSFRVVDILRKRLK